MKDDLIVAIATPRGNAGVGVVRLSGPDSAIKAIATVVLQEVPKARVATYLNFHDPDHTVLDSGIAIFFPEPHSFTGESVLELQAHGGMIVLDALLACVLSQGARLAEPGEFSLRAFLNGKMDLLQAEATADLIDAETQLAARSAVRSLQGAFSRLVNELLEQLTHLRTYVEAAIDFSEEDIDFLKEGAVFEKISAMLVQLRELLQGATQGALLQQGASLVIVGEPNVGKSSLLNRLTDTDTAIVTPIAGTTRDVLKESVQINGVPFHLIDTAGLRDSSDQVEKIGIERAWRAVEQADCLLFVYDAAKNSAPTGDIWMQVIKTIHKTSVPVLIVANKLDIAEKKDITDRFEDYPVIALSATTGEGVDNLRVSMLEMVGFCATEEPPFIARRRHIRGLERVETALLAALRACEADLLDCMAEELRYGQNALGELTGAHTADDLLGNIFSTFCVGK